MHSHPAYRSGRTWVWILVMILALLPFVSLFVYRSSGDRALKKKLNDLQAQGHPITLDDLNDRYALPFGVKNAALIYQDAFDSHVTWDKEKRENLPVIGQAEFPSRTERLDAATKALIIEYLKDNQESLTFLHEAVGIEHCRFAVDFSEGLTATMPWLSKVRESARLLQLDTLIHIDNNDLNTAFESIHCNMALAQSLKPATLIEQFVRYAVFSLNLKSIERLINQCSPSDDQLQGLQSLIESEDPYTELYSAIQGERCMGLALFLNPSSQAADSLVFKGPGRAMGLMKAIGYLQRDTVSYITYMQDILDTLKKPPHEGIQDAKKINPQNYHGLFTQILAPALGRVAELASRTRAHQLTAATSCAIERYRLAHEQLPAQLKDLVPTYLETIPKDPYDGTPLRYKQLNPGYVVYSIGEDLSDNNGQEKKRKSRDPWDVTFTVEK